MGFKSSSRYVSAIFIFLVLFLSAALSFASAPAGYSEYYIPGDEGNMFFIFDTLDTAAIPSSNMHATISVTAWSENITLYYDHWEDGYDFDPANPAATADEVYTFVTAGFQRTFDSASIPLPTSARASCSPAGTCYYDGGDRLYVAGGPVTVTRASYVNATGISNQGAAWEIYPVAPQLTTYVIPFGENFGVTYPDFSRVFTLVQATADNTVVTIDRTGDGAADMLDLNRDGICGNPGDATSRTLNRGETLLLDNISNCGTLNTGVVIKGTETLQVKYVTGALGNLPWISRGLSAFPRGFWSKEYYAPLGDPASAENTDYYLYNPNSSAITVTWESLTASGSFNIAANTAVSFRIASGTNVPVGSGLYFKGNDIFWGVGSNNAAGVETGYREWGYSLLPSTMLYDEHFLGWAPDGLPLAAGNNDNGVFITVAQDNTRVFVDFNNDGTPDQTYTLNRLQSQYIFDPDGDLSGTHFWATGTFSMVYGQNSDLSPTQTPALDIGYVALPGSDFVSLVLTVDKSVTPQVLPATLGATATFTIKVNSQKYTLDGGANGVTVTDYLPPNWQYLTGTDTTSITWPDKTVHATDPSVSGVPATGQTLSWTSAQLGTNGTPGMAENQEVTITFTARTTIAIPAGTLSQNRVKAIGKRTFGTPSQTQTFTTTDFVYVASGNMTVSKTSSATNPLYPGDQFTYTVTATNPTAAAFTGVSLYDPMPAGVSYMAGSGSLTCNRAANVRDEFAAVAYTNNGPNNTANWAGAWTETDIHGTVAGAGAGFVLITGGVLQFRDQTSNYRDDFTTASYARNDGSNNWSGPWTETGDDDTAGGGTITVNAGGNNRVNFGPGAAGRAITRTAAVSGGSVTISFTLSNEGIDNGEGVIAEYDLGLGAGFQEIQRIDNNTLTGTNPLTVNTAGATSLTLRFRTFGTYTGNDDAGVDAVNIVVNNAVGSQIQRTADLTGATSPALNFSYASANLEATDTLVVEASSSAAGPFTTLATFAGNAPSVAPPYNLTPYISATTTIRFRVTGNYDVNNETFSFDNVDISYVAPGTFASGNPPEFLSSAAGCGIQPGGSLTLTYNVTVDNPLATGIEQITNTANINSNEIILPLSASVTNIVVNPASQSAAIISSYVWLDADSDGAKDVGEPGLANVEVILKDQFGTPIATAITDSTGQYMFTGITPGNGYYVEVTSGTLPAGLTQSAPAGHTDNRTDAFNLAAGQSYTAADLGYKPAAGTATFGDLVWSDADGDGIRDFGEPGLAGVVVQLWQDVNKDGAIDGGDTLAGSTTTAAGGGYLFIGVAADGTKDYIVYMDGTQAVLTGFTGTNGYGPAVNVPANSVLTIFDFGFQNSTGTYTIKDRIWNDLNSDNQDDGESGIAGVTVDLLDASRNVIATTLTDASGYFTFNGVIGAGADYTLLVTDTTNVLNNYYGITNEAKAGEVAINNVSANLDYTVEPTEPHFGYGLNRSIGGTVFNDLNGVSGLEAGEPGISGVTVRLYNDINLNGLLDGGDTLRSTLLSDSNGDYLFSGLPDGRYIVSIPSPPAGYNYTTESPDNDPAAGSQQPATIAAGGTVLNLNFGYQAVTPRSISGTVWDDANADGVVDAGETRFQDVTIQILDGATIIGTLSTDVNGNYAFSGLTTKTYTVRITDALGILAGYTDVFENDGVMDSQASLDLTGGNASNIRFGFSLPGVTLVTLSSFRAYEDKGQMRIEWSTSFQRNTAGFYLLRRNEQTGAYTQINRHILPALLSSPQGGIYSIIDNGASLKQSNAYVLVEMEGKGKRNAYGPFTVPAGGGNALQSPDIADLGSRAMAPKGKAGRALKPANTPVQRFTDSNGTQIIAQIGNTDDNAPNSATHQISGYTVRPREISAEKVARLIASKEAAVKTKQLKKLKKGTMAKISLDSEGLYYMDAEEISTLLGLPLNNVRALIKKGRLAMKSQGKEIAYTPAENHAGIFFYGQGMDSIYSRENIYWLFKDKGLRMKSVGGEGPLPAGYSSFAETRHAEEDTTFLNTDMQDPAADYWFWSYLFVAPDYTDLASDSFTIRTDGVADISAKATLTVHLKGFTDTDAAPDHHIRVRLNGSVIGEGWLEGTSSEPPVVIQFDQTLLNSGDNVIGVEAVLDPGVPYSAFYVDSFDISYQRLHEAAGNVLTFRSEDTGLLTVYGFTDPSIIVFDITNPEMPVVELATTIQDEGGSFSVSFAPRSVGSRYLVTTPDAAVTGIDAWADTPSELTSKSNAADYVIIAPDQLKDAVKSLADYRQGQGYQTMVVNLEDIMDEFNYGISSPRAIHDFLAYAYYNWKKAPRYVVLAGEGTYDYKDNMGFGDNLIPTMVVSTPTGLFSSDNYFVDADGDHLPDMAIGRLPVLTAEELQNLLSKIVSFENTLGNHVLMLTDNPDRDGNYPSDSNDIAQLVPGTVSVEKMYLPAYSASEIRNTLLYGIQSGTFLVNYMGHGNAYTLADEGILSIPDVDYMENAGRLFVLSVMSCAVGEFAFPGYDSLSEALVMKKDGGAVAVLAPSGLSLNALSKTLDEGFFSAVFSGSTLTVGDSLREAFRHYKNSGDADFTVDIYNLLGDPALKLKIR